MIYLATIFGSNIPLAIKCTKHYRKTGEKPFTAVAVGINNQTMKKLASKGILQIVSGEKGRDANRYIVPNTTLEVLERRYPELI